MNYYLIYNTLIFKSQLLHDIRLIEKSNGEYYEKHHIIPRCMGGNDDSINLVYLTPEEHFLAHRLLIKIHPDIYDLYLSVQIMIGNGKYTKNNKSYGSVKRIINENKKTLGMPAETKSKISKSRKGMIFTDEHKKNISKSRIGRTWEDIMGTARASELRIERSKTRGPMKEETKLAISKAKLGIQPHEWTDEMKSKVSSAMKGKKKPDSQRLKLKEYNSLEKICPNCGKAGSGPSMQRWHFNNCKENAKN